jgi:iron complex outermembrane receptor protein
MFGSPVDMSVFGTNVTDEEYITFLTGNWNNGLESGQVGQPRMYGVRFKYNFGDY